MNTVLPSHGVLVTGANRGIGLGFARHYFAAHCNVTAACRVPQRAGSLHELARGAGGRLQLAALDVAHEGSLTRFIRELTGRGGLFDLIVSNAGVSIEEQFGAWTEEVFMRTLHVNAVGPALLAQALVPFLAPGAKLVLVSSGMGSISLNVNSAGPLDAYAMSKAGLNIVARRLAAKLAPRGVIVAALNPGWVRTDMGGSTAPSSVEEAVTGMAAVIARLTPADSGSFFGPDGRPLPW